MKPYFQQSGVTIYHGDCREILPALEYKTMITDPVWPNCKTTLYGASFAYELFGEMLAVLKCDRLVVQLGCDSDPRFLASVPSEMKFLRVCWLEYACPTKKGRVLYTGDIAYLFGNPPKSAPGRRIMPGRYISTKSDANRVKCTRHKEWGKPNPSEHPCPRRLQHVQWLVGKFGEGVICDPFCGSGTTLLAAKQGGYSSIGIEIEERFCEMAAKRLSQEMLNLQ